MMAATTEQKSNMEKWISEKINVRKTEGAIMFKNGQSRDKKMWECYIISIFELQPQIVS